jgi:hypothetical protein
MFALSVIWAVMAAGVVILALVRKFASANDDEYVHLNPAQSSVWMRQFSVARTLDAIDHWGVTMTVVVLVYGLVLLGAYLYQGWQQSQIISN